jgi:hypothetical protein
MSFRFSDFSEIWTSVEVALPDYFGEFGGESVKAAVPIWWKLLIFLNFLAHSGPVLLARPGLEV